MSSDVDRSKEGGGEVRARVPALFLHETRVDSKLAALNHAVPLFAGVLCLWVFLCLSLPFSQVYLSYPRSLSLGFDLPPRQLN